MLASYRISYIDVTSGELCLAANLFFLISQTRSRSTAQKEERRSHSCFILKACYLALFLFLIKENKEKNGLKASQKGIHFVSRTIYVASKVNFLPLHYDAQLQVLELNFERILTF